MAAQSSSTSNTYLLRDLAEVIPPEAISWWPQTLGWKILGIILLICLFYFAVTAIRRWWQNRYRREALSALHQIDCRQVLKARLELMHIVKHTANYAFPTAAIPAQISDTLLKTLDSKVTTESKGDKQVFNTPTGQRWQASLWLPDDSIDLNEQDIQSLKETSIFWVKNHQRGAVA